MTRRVLGNTVAEWLMGAAALVVPVVMVWLLLLLFGCAIPIEEHGGVSHRTPAPDAAFIGGGFALDGGLAALKVPAVPRGLAVAGAMWAVRVPKWGGRTESAHLLVFSGAFLREWLAGMIRGLR